MNLILITSLLYLLFNASLASANTGVYFSHDSTTEWEDIKYYGDSTIYNNILQLTAGSRYYKYGWVTYNTSIPLVDGVTGEPASFLTHFSFVINTSSVDGYGFAFFMSPKGLNSSHGGTFGLFSDPNYLNNSQNQAVAVEFDTYGEEWDPPFKHVGIDVNSIHSVVVHKADSDILTNGTLTHVWVSYSAGKQLLNVYLNSQGDSKLSAGDPILSYKINLTQVLSTTVMVGFSAANYYSEAHQILSWEFNSTIGYNTSPSLKPKSRPEVYTVVLCTIAVMVLVLGGTGWFLMWLKNSLIKKREDHRELPRKYSYKELVVATSNFAEKNKLGEGGFGPVFKGYLRDTCDDVAVKYLKQQSDRGTKQFKAEVDILSKLRHPNLVELFGWGEENGQLLLVYKYMPNGSLDSPLFDMHRLLLWPKRYEIVLNLTDALCYLQVENECNKEVVHRDIKPENLLLDSSLNAKLSDFGLAKLVDHGFSVEKTALAGSWGYMAPELFSYDDRINKPSTQSDIYSFGIVLLVIACGRRPVDLDLIRFVWEHYGRNELLKAADERLKGEYNAKEIERVMFVGLWCAHPVASDRPDIGLARKALKFQECKLPVLPNYPRLLSHINELLS